MFALTLTSQDVLYLCTYFSQNYITFKISIILLFDFPTITDQTIQLGIPSCTDNKSANRAAVHTFENTLSGVSAASENLQVLISEMSEVNG